jgi:endonuclease/exonuclease/phosphatase family metal-dependent hydrolase
VERGNLLRELIKLLTPTASYLAKKGLPDDIYLDTLSVNYARLIWSALVTLMESNPQLTGRLHAFASAPENAQNRKDLESILADTLSTNSVLEREIEVALEELGKSRGVGQIAGTGVDRSAFGRPNEVVRRLDVLRLLRSGIQIERIAEKFGMSAREVLGINYDYSVGGVRGAAIRETVPSWLEQLDSGDPVLRRLEMVRLLRAGTPCSTVARQFDALEDYVILLGEKFAEHGLPGIITEEDLERFLSLGHKEIRICTYNLHGVQREDPFRFRRMARDLSRYRPDLIAFQEVINGAGVEDTSGQVSRWLSAMTGEHYRSHFTYCHQFMDRYPEGVAVCARVRATMVKSIDLTTNLKEGLRPSMDRLAQMVEATMLGRKVILVSVHLDHLSVGEVRLAQAEKLVAEIDGLAATGDCHAVILAGDFNDTQDSPALKCLKDAGYRDAYRAHHRGGGNTFPTPKPEARIDYILVKGPAEIVSAELILNNPDLSDHLGVAAVVR